MPKRREVEGGFILPDKATSCVYMYDYLHTHYPKLRDVIRGVGFESNFKRIGRPTTFLIPPESVIDDMYMKMKTGDAAGARDILANLTVILPMTPSNWEKWSDDITTLSGFKIPVESVKGSDITLKGGVKVSPSSFKSARTRSARGRDDSAGVEIVQYMYKLSGPLPALTERSDRKHVVVFDENARKKAGPRGGNRGKKTDDITGSFEDPSLKPLHIKLFEGYESDRQTVGNRVASFVICALEKFKELSDENDTKCKIFKALLSSHPEISYFIITDSVIGIDVQTLKDCYKTSAINKPFGEYISNFTNNSAADAIAIKIKSEIDSLRSQKVTMDLIKTSFRKLHEEWLSKYGLKESDLSLDQHINIGINIAYIISLIDSNSKNIVEYLEKNVTSLYSGGYEGITDQAIEVAVKCGSIFYNNIGENVKVGSGETCPCDKLHEFDYDNYDLDLGGSFAEYGDSIKLNKLSAATMKELREYVKVYGKYPEVE